MRRFALCLALLSALPLARPAAASEPAASNAVDAVRDVPYYEAKDADPEKHKLDLYLPKGKKDFPVVVFVHGGSWRSGDRRHYARLGEAFARNGVGAVIPSYRLSPKVLHPEHVKDVARAFAWTCRHIAERGGNADQIFACGHSAGGHLVALLATDPAYLKAEGLSPDRIKGVIPISGVYTILPGRLSPAFGPDEEVCRLASPLEHVTGKHPPFLLLYADKDFLTLDAMAYLMGKALQKVGVEAVTRKISDRDHKTIIMKMVEQADPTLQAVLEFVRKHSGAEPGQKLTPK